MLMYFTGLGCGLSGCGLSLSQMWVLALVPRGFSPGKPGFPNIFPKLQFDLDTVDEEQLCRCATADSLQPDLETIRRLKPTDALSNQNSANREQRRVSLALTYHPTKPKNQVNPAG